MLFPRMSSSTRSTSLSNVSTYSYYNKALFTRATTVVLVLVVAQLGTILYVENGKRQLGQQRGPKGGPDQF